MSIVLTYVSTLGFHSTRVTRPVLRHGVSDNDTVVLLRPADDDSGDRAEEEITDIRRTLGEVSSEIDVRVERVEHEDFDAAVRQCLSVLRDAKGNVIAGFGGGPREIFLPFTIAVLVARDEIDRVFQFNDIDRSVRELTLPDLMTPLSDQSLRTLNRIGGLDGETTLPELAEASDLSKSTLGRHLDELESAEAVRTRRDGKTRTIQLTLGGELRLRRQGSPSTVKKSQRRETRNPD